MAERRSHLEPISCSDVHLAALQRIEGAQRGHHRNIDLQGGHHRNIDLRGGHHRCDIGAPCAGNMYTSVFFALFGHTLFLITHPSALSRVRCDALLLNLRSALCAAAAVIDTWFAQAVITAPRVVHV